MNNRVIRIVTVGFIFLATGCVTRAKIPGVNEPLDSEKWTQCAGEMEETEKLVIDLSLDAQTMLCRGVTFAALGKTEEGLELLAESAVRNKEDHRPYYMSGRILASLGRYEEALTAFERARRRFSAMEVPTERLATSLLKEKGEEQARMFLSKANERGLCSYGCQRLYATLLREIGETEKAKASYLTMIKTDPDEPAAYVGLAGLYNSAGDYKREAEMLSRARAAGHFVDLSRAQQADVNYSLAFSFYNLKNFPEAAVAIKDAIANREDFPDAYLLAGWIDLKREHFKKALESFEKASALSRSLGSAYTGAGDAQMALDQVDEARIAYERARELQPNDVVVVLKLAYAVARAGDTAEAQRLLDMARTLDGEHLPEDLVSQVMELLK